MVGSVYPMRPAALLLLVLLALPLVSGCVTTRKQQRARDMAALSDDVDMLLAEANGMLAMKQYGQAALRFEKLYDMKPDSPSKLLQIRSGLFESRLFAEGEDFDRIQREEREAARGFFELWMVYPHDPSLKGYGELSDLARLAALVLTAEAAETDPSIASGPDTAVPALGLGEENFTLGRMGCGPGGKAQWDRTREQRTEEQDGRQFDVLTVTCHGGGGRELWFDLTIWNRLVASSRGEVEPPEGFTVHDARRIISLEMERAIRGGI